MRKFLFITILLFASSAFGQDPGKWAKFDGHRIHYYETGNTRASNALVFVHGWTCSADFWDKSLSAFPGTRVISIDLIGHGQSDKPKVSYTMDYFARSVDAVLKSAKVKKAVLAGHSMGTPVIRQYYRLFPDKTLGLVIVDGAMRPYLKSEVFEQFFAPIRADYEKNVPAFIDGMLDPVKDSGLKAWIRSAMLSTPGHVAISAMDGMGEEKIWATDRIKVPVIAVMAASPAWKSDEEQFFRSIAPNLEFHMWTGVSHFLMMEKPDEFNALVKAYITKNKLL